MWCLEPILEWFSYSVEHSEWSRKMRCGAQGVVECQMAGSCQMYVEYNLIDRIPFRTIPGHQRLRSRTQKMRQWDETLLFYRLIQSRKMRSFGTIVRILPNYDRMIRFPAARFHVNKQRCEAHAIESSSHPPVSRENASTHFVSYSGTYLHISSQIVAIHSYSRQPIVISIFDYLFHSTCGVGSMLLTGDNSNVPPFPAAGSVKWASRFALAALHAGVAHQLPIAVFKQQCASRATTILAEWARRYYPSKCTSNEAADPG